MTVSRREIKGAAPSGSSAPTLTTAITELDASFTVGGSVTGFPDGSVGRFVVTIDRGESSEEKVLCTARSGQTFTVAQRGYDGTSAHAHLAGARVEHTIDATLLDEMNRFTARLSGGASYDIATEPAAQLLVEGDTNPRLELRPDSIRFGPGSGSLDVVLSRLQADVLALQDELRAIRSSASLTGLATAVSGESVPRFAVEAGGRAKWSDGASQHDVAIARTGAGALEVDGLLTSDNLIRGAGAPEGSITAEPGTIYQRTDAPDANTAVYVKASGSGNTGWRPLREGPAYYASGEPVTVAGTTPADLVSQSLGPFDAGTRLRVTVYGVCTTAGTASFTFTLGGETVAVWGSQALSQNEAFWVQWDITTPTASSQIHWIQAWANADHDDAELETSSAGALTAFAGSEASSVVWTSARTLGVSAVFSTDSGSPVLITSGSLIEVFD